MFAIASQQRYIWPHQLSFLSMALYGLIYKSTPAKVLTEAGAEELLSVARTANETFGITGMLLCFPNMYLQLIEGDQPDILRLYENIRHDERHFSVTTLREGFLDKRYFPDWSMGYDRSAESFDQAHAFHFSGERSNQLLEILETWGH
jgi:hypothetical protein